jgi:predicted metal-dependent hydrolase
VLHLLLPAGESWFIDVFTQALPMIKDDKLREEVLGFIGQEAADGDLAYTGRARVSMPFLDELEALGPDRV